MHQEYTLDAMPVYHKVPHTNTHNPRGNLEKPVHRPAWILGCEMN